MWDGRPPRSAAETLQGYVVHLRQALAGANGGPGSVIVTSHTGYCLQAPEGSIDALSFVALLARARGAATRRDWGSARAFVNEGLALWRGPAYADVLDCDLVAPEAIRLEEQRLVAVELRAEVDLALGEDVALLPDLQKVLADHPTRERSWELLIRAQYRAGRQSDALASFACARQVLAEELGVEPGPALRAVHAAVLSQDPELDAPTSRPTTGRSTAETAGYAFDGRDADLEWLRSQWLAMLDRGGRIAVVAGAAGVGKTRLLATFAGEIERVEALVIRRTGMTAPNPASIAAVADGRPALVVLDDPLTGLAPESLAGHRILIVVAVDYDQAPAHVLTSLDTSPWHQLEPLAPDACERIARRWTAGLDDCPDVAAIVDASGGVPARLHESARRGRR